MTEPLHKFESAGERRSPFSRGASSGALAAAGAILLWCWSAPCFAAGARLAGAMPFLTLSCIVGVATGMAFHRWRDGAFPDLFRLPARVIGAGFLGQAVYTVLLVQAVALAEEADLGQVALINYLWPIFMVALGLALLDERPRPSLVVAAAALGFAGVVIVRGADTFTRPPSSLLPHGLALAGAFLWAAYCVLLKRWQVPEAKSGSTLQWILCGGVAAVLGIVNGEWAAMPGLTLPAVFWMLFCGIGPVGLAYYWWELALKRGAAHLAAVLAYFIPVGSALLIALLFREALSPGLAPGAALIVAGAFLGRRATRDARG